MSNTITINLDIEAIVQAAEKKVVETLVKRTLEGSYSIERNVTNRLYFDIEDAVKQKAMAYVTEELVERTAQHYLTNVTEDWIEKRLEQIVHRAVDSYLLSKERDC